MVKQWRLIADNHSTRTVSDAVYHKDILRVGKWRVGSEIWDVTEDTLDRIASNFASGQRLGLDCPLVWNHSNDARDRIGRVISIWREGDALLASISVSDADGSAKIVNAGGVSVEVSEAWKDGLDNEYDIMLTHVGVVNHPVVPGQNEFVRVSSTERKAMRIATRALAINGKRTIFTRHLAEGEVAAPDEIVSEGTALTDPTAYPSLDDEQFNAVKSLIETLLKRSDNITLPSDLTGETLIATVKNMLATLEQIKPTVTESTTDEALDEVDPASMAPAELQMALTRYRKREADRKVADQTSELIARSAKRSEFQTRVAALVVGGKIQAVLTPALMALGENKSYDMSLLAPYEQIESVVKVTTKTGSKVIPKIGSPTFGEQAAQMNRVLGISSKK